MENKTNPLVSAVKSAAKHIAQALSPDMLNAQGTKLLLAAVVAATLGSAMPTSALAQSAPANAAPAAKVLKPMSVTEKKNLSAMASLALQALVEFKNHPNKKTENAKDGAKVDFLTAYAGKSASGVDVTSFDKIKKAIAAEGEGFSKGEMGALASTVVMSEYRRTVFEIQASAYPARQSDRQSMQ